MIKYLISFHLIFFSTFSSFAVDSLYEQPLTTNNSKLIISYAREFRTNTTLAPATEEARKKKILEQVKAAIAYYQSQDRLEDSVSPFVMDALALSSSDFSLIDTKQTSLAGKTSDVVYMVLDRNGLLTHVVKAFRNPFKPNSKFLSEISALDFLVELQLPGTIPIQPIAFAICQDQHQEWGVVIETAATGKRIDHYAFELATALDPQELELRLEKAKKAFARMGESLARLHANKSSAPGSMPQETIDKYDDRLKQILDHPFAVQELSKQIPLSDFANYVEEVKRQALRVPVFYSYTHGDPNSGNTFYDPDWDAFYFIDLSGLHPSVDIFKQPLADGALDLVKVEISFRKRVLNVLREELVEELLQSFYEAYEREAGGLPDERICLAYKTYLNLGRLVQYSNYHEIKDPLQRSIKKALFEEAIHYFTIKHTKEELVLVD